MHFQEAVGRIGLAVFNGGVTTFLALVLLGASSSHVFLSFFKVIIFVNEVMNKVGFSPICWCSSMTGRLEQQAVWWFVGITRFGLHRSIVAASPLTTAMRPGLCCSVKRSGSPSSLKSRRPVSISTVFILHNFRSISVALESMLIWR